MTKDLPYFRFYPGDWARTTRILSISAKAAWIEILAAMWSNANQRGTLTLPTEAWVRLLGMSEKNALKAIEELTAAQLCQREDLPDGTLRLSSPTMIKDADDLQAVARAESDQARRAASTRWSKSKPQKPESEATKTDADALLTHCPRNADVMPTHSSRNADAMRGQCETMPSQKSDVISHSTKGDSPLPPESPAPDSCKQSVRIPTLNETIEYAKVQGLNREVAATWWYDRDGEGWARLTGNWTSNLTGYIRKWESRQAEGRTQSSRATQKPYSEMTDAEILRAAMQ